MALIGKISIAMGVNTAGLSKGLAASGKMLTGFQATIQQTSGLMTTLFAGAAFAAVATGFKKLVSAGSDIIENQKKVKAVFALTLVFLMVLPAFVDGMELSRPIYRHYEI